MERRRVLAGGVTWLAVGVAGCATDDADRRVPSDEAQRQHARENAEDTVDTDPAVQVNEYKSTETAAGGLTVEASIENTASERVTVEADLGAYDQHGDLFFVTTDAVGVLAPGVAIPLEYHLDPTDFEAVTEILAFQLGVWVTS